MPKSITYTDSISQLSAEFIKPDDSVLPIPDFKKIALSTDGASYKVTLKDDTLQYYKIVPSEKYCDELGKYIVVSNEFGILTLNATLFQETVEELKDNVYNIAYSDSKDSGNAIALSTKMIDFLK